MSSFCSVHTHSRLCDGEDALAEMARAAFAAGAVSFGASGHSHTPIPEDEGGVLPADMTAYRAEVLRLREEYAGSFTPSTGTRNGWRPARRRRFTETPMPWRSAITPRSSGWRRGSPRFWATLT